MSEDWRPIAELPEGQRNCLLAARLFGQTTCAVGEADRDEDGRWWWANTIGEYHSDPIDLSAELVAWMPMPKGPA